jgi:hypothetical protein
VAFSATSGAVLTIPMQFGPIRRIPVARQSRRSARSRSRPSASTSPKPAVSTTRARTPFRPHCSATSSTCAAGTAITARSTGPGIASTVEYASTLWTTGAVALTG